MKREIHINPSIENADSSNAAGSREASQVIEKYTAEMQ